MAISSVGTVLKWGTSADAVAKVVDIKTYGDLIGDPSLLDTTTLTDTQRTNIPGLKDSQLQAFTCNYTSADFAAAKADEDKDLYYALEFSDGSKFTWQGRHTCGLPGKGVDEVVEFTINVVPSSVVEFTAAG